MEEEQLSATWERHARPLKKSCMANSARSGDVSIGALLGLWRRSRDGERGC